VHNKASLVTALLLLVTSQAQSVVLNGGFELPGLPPLELSKSLTNGSTFLPGWTVVDNALGELPFYGKNDLDDLAFSGAYGVALNQGSGITTTFRAEPNRFYEFSVWLSPDSCKVCEPPSPLEVTISGNTYVLPYVSGWSRQTLQFYTTNSINTLKLFNASSSPDLKRFKIDDVSVLQVPGATLGVQLLPVVTLTGNIGSKYEIQSAATLNSPTWKFLRTITLSNSPTFFLDTNLVSNFDLLPLQIYRAIRLP
jgi:hypothetical protein